MGACCCGSRKSNTCLFRKNVRKGYPCLPRKDSLLCSPASPHSSTHFDQPQSPYISDNLATGTSNISSTFLPTCLQKRKNDLLIWLDDNPCPPTQSEDRDGFLKEASEHVNADYGLYQDIEACYKYMTENVDNRSFVLIVSGALGRSFIKRVHQLQSLKSVFVFCLNIADHREWSKKYDKVIGCCDDEDDLLWKLGQWFRKDHRDRTTSYRRCQLRRYIGATTTYPSLSVIFRPGDDNSVIQDASKNTRKNILYESLLKILLKMPREDNHSRRDMSVLFKEHQSNLSNVPQHYESSMACEWFSKYRVLREFIDKLWKKENLEKLYRSRHFIIDLQEQICKSGRLSEGMRVFYACCLTFEEVRKLEQNKNELIYINSFIAGTSDKTLALKFTSPSSLETSNIYSVLFELDTKEQSVFQSGKTVILPIGLHYEIQSVQQSFDGIYIIKLVICNNTHPQWKAVTDDLEAQSGKETSPLMFANILCQMGEYQEAERFYKICLQEKLFRDDIVYNNLGYLYYQQENFEEALKYNEQALELRLSGTIVYTDLSTTYNNLSMIYNALNQFTKSKDLLESAILYQLGTDVKDDQLVTTLAYSSGLLAHQQNYLEDALNNFTQALSNYYSSNLPRYDPTLLQLLIAQAETYQKLNLTQKAYDTYKQALEIASYTLSDTDPTIQRLIEKFKEISENLDEEVSRSMRLAETSAAANKYLGLRPFDFTN